MSLMRRQATSLFRNLSTAAPSARCGAFAASLQLVGAWSPAGALATQEHAARAVPMWCSVACRGFAAKAAKGGKNKGGNKNSDDGDDGDDRQASSSSGGKGKGKGAPAAAPAAPAFDSAAAKGKFQGVVDAFQKEMSKLRATRASAGMLSHVEVAAYEGSVVQLHTLGTIAARDAQTLTVMLYDPSTADAVQKAIMAAKVGMPRLEGEVVVVPVPPLTAETRASLLTVVNSASEASKASLRRVRKDMMDSLKKLRDSMGEDEVKRREKEVQAMTDAAMKDVEALAAEKVKDIKGGGN